jgi:hypothetical protein
MPGWLTAGQVSGSFLVLLGPHGTRNDHSDGGPLGSPSSINPQPLQDWLRCHDRELTSMIFSAIRVIRGKLCIRVNDGWRN